MEKSSAGPAVKPPIIYKTALLIMATGKFSLWPTAVPMFSSRLVSVGLGVPIFLAFAKFAADSKKTFKRTGTPMMGGPISGKSPLHTSGAFSWTRNPMYLGISVALVGAAIASNCWWHLLLPAINALIMHVYYIPIEERELEKEFGEKYLDYKRRVPRWLWLV
jgi:protein-S-isoprenylcysteine O-methyltransferase Ste14